MFTHWKTLHYIQGDEPVADIMMRFADAWILALPYPQYDGKTWHMEDRAAVEARFAAGETEIMVGWTTCKSAWVIIQKVENAPYHA